MQFTFKNEKKKINAMRPPQFSFEVFEPTEMNTTKRYEFQMENIFILFSLLFSIIRLFLKCFKRVTKAKEKNSITSTNNGNGNGTGSKSMKRNNRFFSNRTDVKRPIKMCLTYG